MTGTTPSRRSDSTATEGEPLKGFGGGQGGSALAADFGPNLRSESRLWSLSVGALDALESLEGEERGPRREERRARAEGPSSSTPACSHLPIARRITPSRTLRSRKAAFRGSFARPSASLSTLRRRPYGIGPRKTRFRLVASLCRVGLHTCRVPSERFPLCRLTPTSLPPFPGFAWRTMGGTFPGATLFPALFLLFPRPAHLLNRGRVAVEPSMEGVPARNAPERT